MRRLLASLVLLAGLSAALAHAQGVEPVAAEPVEPPPVVADGVTIASIAVGGMTAEQATAAVQAFFDRPVAFQLRGRSWQASPLRLGASADVAGAVTAALAAPASGVVPLAVSVDRNRLRAYVARLVRDFYRPARNSTVRLRNLRPYVTRARKGVRVRPLATRVLIRQALSAHERGPLELLVRGVRPRVRRSNFGPVIVIRRESKLLILYRGARYWARFGVATGQASYPTPLGRFSIVTKQRHPWWYPPNTDWAAGASPIPPGPGNPLGTRWMGLSAGGVGIHGTPDAASIGYSASHGCIRMRIPQAEWLFERARVGTPVFIVGA